MIDLDSGNLRLVDLLFFCFSLYFSFLLYFFYFFNIDFCWSLFESEAAVWVFYVLYY